MGECEGEGEKKLDKMRRNLINKTTVGARKAFAKVWPFKNGVRNITRRRDDDWGAKAVQSEGCFFVFDITMWSRWRGAEGCNVYKTAASAI